MEKVSSVMALSFNENRESAGSVCINCILKFYFVIKIGAKDTNAGLMELFYTSALFYFGAREIYYIILGFSKVLCSTFRFQELRRSLQVR